MPRSLDWTVGRLWREAVRDLRLDNGRLLGFEELHIVNRVVSTIIAEFYSVFAVDYMTESSGLTVTSDAADISTLRIARGGNQARMVLTSTALANRVCRPLSLQALKTWRPAAKQNAKNIVWCLDGQRLLLRKGNSVTSYSTVKLHYPALPTEATTTTDKVDLPDGAPIELALKMLKKVLSERYTEKAEDHSSEVAMAVANIMNQYRVSASLEEVQDKVKALS